MSKQIKIAFFKAKHGSLLSKTIKFVTNSEYSHTELVIGDVWYGSNINLMGESGITKFTKPRIIPDEWKIVSVNVSDKQYKDIKKDANLLVGSGYAFINAIKSQFSLFNVETKDEFFCSEFVAYLLTKHKVIKLKDGKPAKYDPGHLYNEFNNKLKYTAKKYKKINFAKLAKTNYSSEELYLTW